MLEKELGDVNVDSSTTPDDTIPETEEESKTEEKPSVEEKPKEEDRIYNLQREFERKMEKQQQDLLQSQERMIEAIVGKISEAAQSNRQPSTLEDMTLTQLQDLKREASKMENVDASAISQIDDAIVERRVRDLTESRLGSFEKTQQLREASERAKAEALATFPDLRNPQSEFYKKVDQELQLRGPEWVKSNPQAVLDVAARVALKEGVKPTPRAPIPSIARSNTTPVKEDKDKIQITDEMRKLAKIYSKAVPKGKLTEEDLKQIAEETHYYKTKHPHFRSEE